GALQRVDNRAQVTHLIIAPPRRVFPGVRQDVNLFGARQSADLAIAARLIIGPRSDSSVQLKADLVAPRRIVSRRDINGEIVLGAVPGAVAQKKYTAFLRRVAAPALQPTPGLVKGDTGFRDFFGNRGRLLWRCRRPELRKGLIERVGRSRLRPGRRSYQKSRRDSADASESHEVHSA